MSHPAPLVSVITATYNWSAVLRHAIESVRRQSVQDFEMLVVGDCCTDDSAEVVASFRDDRLRWHNLPENAGSQSGPNNAGLKLARGRYVAYLGHDDIWHPAHLRLLVDQLERTGADFAHSLSVYVGPPGSGIRVLHGLPRTDTYSQLVWAPPSSWMHRREMIEQTGAWKDYRTIVEAPDVDFLTRIWASGKRATWVNELTLFKFPSTWRRNSYVEKPSQEQAEYLQRIQTEPDFLYRELKDIAIAYALKKPDWPPEIPRPNPSQDKTPGGMVKYYRWLRGLEKEGN